MANAVYWTGGVGDYKWLSPGNWSTGMVPQSTDDVVIGAPGNDLFTVRLSSGGNAQSVQSLNCYENLALGGTSQIALYLAQPSIMDANLTLDRCTLHLSSSLSLAGISTWNSNGSITGAGKLIIPSTGVLTVAPFEDSAYLSCEIDNSGIINYTGTASWSFAGGVINNGNDGTFNASGNGLVASVGINTFNNSGQFNKIGDGLFSSPIPFNNSGTMDISDGTLQLAGVANSGKVLVNQGTHFETTMPLSNTGSIDIAGGVVLLDQGLALDSVRGQLKSGFDFGAWDGAGINSSLVANNPGTGIGYRVDGSATTLFCTWLGDVDLNGIVNHVDLDSMAASGSTGGTWSDGDFNYDGVVNADDYALFQIGADYGSAANIATIFPEPADAGCGFGLVLILIVGARSARRARAV